TTADASSSAERLWPQPDPASGVLLPERLGASVGPAPALRPQRARGQPQQPHAWVAEEAWPRLRPRPPLRGASRSRPRGPTLRSLQRAWLLRPNLSRLARPRRLPRRLPRRSSWRSLPLKIDRRKVRPAEAARVGVDFLDSKQPSAQTELRATTLRALPPRRPAPQTGPPRPSHWEQVARRRSARRSQSMVPDQWASAEPAAP